MVLRYTCTKTDNERDVYFVLREKLNISASLVKRLKKTNGIFVNDMPKYTNHLLQAGDIVCADVGLAEPPSDIVPQQGEIDILYENEGVLAVNKPSGILVHPSHARYMDTLSNYVAGYLEQKGEKPFCHTVNRLDRDTSGVVLFAKNGYMKAKALANMAGATKKYLALVYGKPPEKTATIDLPIKRLEKGDMLRGVSPDGQVAVTHYKVVKTIEIQGQTISLIQLLLETGRTHQIRVHLSAIGCPILGDVLYYTEQSKRFSQAFGITAQTLHAESLTFMEPMSGEEMEITAPIKRKDMQAIFDKIET